MKEQSVKQIVSEFLGYLKHKVDTDAMTMEDVKGLARAIMEGIHVTGTVKDLATFYGKSEDCVRHVISNRVVEKPRRRVLYSFGKVSRAVPSSWHNEGQPPHP